VLQKVVASSADDLLKDFFALQMYTVYMMDVFLMDVCVRQPLMGLPVLPQCMMYDECVPSQPGIPAVEARGTYPMMSLESLDNME